MVEDRAPFRLRDLILVPLLAGPCLLAFGVRALIESRAKKRAALNVSPLRAAPRPIQPETFSLCAPETFSAAETNPMKRLAKRARKAPAEQIQEDRATLAALRALSDGEPLRGSQRELGRRIDRSATSVNRALRLAQETKSARVSIAGGRTGQTEIEFLN